MILAVFLFIVVAFSVFLFLVVVFSVVAFVVPMVSTPASMCRIRRRVRDAERMWGLNRAAFGWADGTVHR